MDDGYTRWNGGTGHTMPEHIASRLNDVERTVRQEFQAEIANGLPIADDVLADMRRRTAELLAVQGLQASMVRWMRDVADPTSVVMYA